MGFIFGSIYPKTLDVKFIFEQDSDEQKVHRQFDNWRPMATRLLLDEMIISSSMLVSSVCMFVCLFVCMFVSALQVTVLVQSTSKFYNGFFVEFVGLQTFLVEIRTFVWIRKIRKDPENPYLSSLRDFQKFISPSKLNEFDQIFFCE